MGGSPPPPSMPGTVRRPTARPAAHLALPAAPVAPPHQALVVLVLLGQVVVENALCHGLRAEREKALRDAQRGRAEQAAGSRGPGFGSRLVQALAAWPWPWPGYPPCVSFLACKMGMLMTHPSALS